MSPQYRVLIADDERPARSKLLRYLKDHPDFTVAGEAEDGEQALAQIESLQPDLVFLDIHMPGLSGFEVLDALEMENPPRIVFTTAYDQYALKAFEVPALDYLLKPFEEERFHAALDRFRDNAAGGAEGPDAAALRALPWASNYRERFLVRERGRVVPVRADDLRRISSEEKYVRLHLPDRSVLYRLALGQLEAQLDPDRFVRVHRTEIVNLDAIRELQPWSHGDYVLLLENGETVPVSRSYRKGLFDKLGG